MSDMMRQNNSDAEGCIDEIIASIKNRKTVVFCGAGISYYSGIPLVNPFLAYLFGKLTTNQSDIDKIINSYLPFEAIMQHLDGSSRMDRLFDIYESMTFFSFEASMKNIFNFRSRDSFRERVSYTKHPNVNHILLAKLAQLGYLEGIYTTNFDRFIEDALKLEGLSVDQDFAAIYDSNHFPDIHRRVGKIKVIKLHGSIVDRNNLGIMMRQVSSQTPSEQRRGVMNEIFSQGSHENVLILGYSCSDVFDLSKHIEDLSSNFKRVVCIEHVEEQGELRNAPIEDIYVKEDKNPFKNFRNGSRVYCHTDAVVRKIWEGCLNEPFPSGEKFGKNYEQWKDCVNDWYLRTISSHSKAFNGHIMCRLLTLIGENERAEWYLKNNQKVHRRSRFVGDRKKREMVDLCNQARLYHQSGNSRKAVDEYLNVLGIAEDLQDTEEQAKILCALSGIYHSLEMYLEGRDAADRCLEITGVESTESVACVALLNLSIIDLAEGNYPDAITIGNKALNIASTNGYKNEEVTILGNLAMIHYSKRDNDEAIKLADEVIRLAGDWNPSARGRALATKGRAYLQIFVRTRDLEDLQKAKDFGEQALAVAESCGDKEGESLAKSDLELVYQCPYFSSLEDSSSTS